MKLNFALLTVIGLFAMACSQQPISQECFTRPNEGNPKDCCKAPNVIPPKDQFAECMQKYPKPSEPPTPGSMPPNHNCLAQCMFEQQGIMADGAVSKDAAISKTVAVMGGSSEWEATTKNVVEACYQKVSALGAQKDSQGCSVMAGSFLDCMPSMMFTNCPSSAWTASTECEQMKAHLQKGCPIFTLWKGPPSH
ncbi:general odorant-binding protein 66 [Aedes aegypti]|uniref:OBP47-like domain-containing protein n=1 Tax=Aedes aegypti TaxID=7159 RepID=A0A1S4FTG8_AEDAE|nr:general odorant-binding protein 66 [Aedes aegypti]